MILLLRRGQILETFSSAASSALESSLITRQKSTASVSDRWDDVSMTDRTCKNREFPRPSLWNNTSTITFGNHITVRTYFGDRDFGWFQFKLLTWPQHAEESHQVWAKMEASRIPLRNDETVSWALGSFGPTHWCSRGLAICRGSETHWATGFS